MSDLVLKIVTAEEFRQYSNEFADLYALCFNQPMTTEEVIWRYFKNLDKNIFACFAFDNGKLIANYSVSPIRIQNGTSSFKAVLSLNTMTHSNYMGRGLFVKLAEQVYAYAAQKGYKCVIGFPNNISNRTFIQKLGWKNITIYPTMKMDIGETIRFKKPEGIQIRETFNFPYPKDENNLFRILKNQEYMNWRFDEHPSNEYFYLERECSYFCCKKYNDILNIVDYRTDNCIDFEDLLKYAIVYAKENGFNHITLWCPVSSLEHLTLEKYRFYMSSPLTYFGGRIFDNTYLNYNEFYSEKNWFISMADDNVY